MNYLYAAAENLLEHRPALANVERFEPSVSLECGGMPPLSLHPKGRSGIGRALMVQPKRRPAGAVHVVRGPWISHFGMHPLAEGAR